MSDLIHRRIEAARRGENPTVVRHMPSGWAVLCDWQRLPGYVILLADPVVADLNALGAGDRVAFLRDMVLIGDALLEVTDAERINYQILGNTDPFLHAHICPRYGWEDPELRRGPTAHYDRSVGPMFDLERDRPLMDRLRAALDGRLHADDATEAGR